MMSWLQHAHVNASDYTLAILVAGIAGSTEQNTTRWVMTCLRILEEVDAANPDGIGILLQWNSSGNGVSYTVSQVQCCH